MSGIFNYFQIKPLGQRGDAGDVSNLAAIVNWDDRNWMFALGDGRFNPSFRIRHVQVEV